MGSSSLSGSAERARLRTNQHDVFQNGDMKNLVTFVDVEMSKRLAQQESLPVLLLFSPVSPDVHA